MAVTGLLTGHNTVRRHLYIMGLIDSPLCRRCGTEDETSAHVLCVCVKPWLHSDTPEDVRSLRRSAALTTSNFTWIDLGSNPDLRGERPATNHVSHGTAFKEENEPEVCFNIYSTTK
jgi:hypothetical protein